MKFNDAFPSKYLKADDLMTPRLLTINGVRVEELGGEQKDRKPVVYFQGEPKGLILNRVNYASITSIASSDDTDHWMGKQIVLFRDMTTMRGQMTPCVRIRAPRTTPQNAQGMQIPDPGEPPIGTQRMAPPPSSPQQADDVPF